jgi:hypothetical protein
VLPLGAQAEVEIMVRSAIASQQSRIKGNAVTVLCAVIVSQEQFNLHDDFADWNKNRTEELLWQAVDEEEHQHTPNSKAGQGKNGRDSSVL